MRGVCFLQLAIGIFAASDQNEESQISEKSHGKYINAILYRVFLFEVCIVNCTYTSVQTIVPTTLQSKAALHPMMRIIMTVYGLRWAF